MTKDGTHILSLDNGYHLWSRTDRTGKPIKLLTLHGGPDAGHVHMVDDSEIIVYNLKHFIQDVEAHEFVPEK